MEVTLQIEFRGHVVDIELDDVPEGMDWETLIEEFEATSLIKAINKSTGEELPSQDEMEEDE